MNESRNIAQADKSRKTVPKLRDTAYFYITEVNEEGTKNVLYAVGFTKDEMYVASTNSYFMKLTPVTELEGELYALQGEPANGKTKTFLERIKPNGKGERVELRRGEGVEDRLVFYMDSYDGHIYTYEESEDAANIEKYDPGFRLVSQTDITDIVLAYPFGSVGILHVFGDYFPCP